MLVVFLTVKSCSDRSTANEHVIDQVKERHKDAAWMKHVTDWDTTSVISVETDYPPEDLTSYARAYEICRTVESEYAPDANHLPKLFVYGADTTVKIEVDGTKRPEIDKVVLAQSTKLSDYRCGITPTRDVRDKAKSLHLRINLH